MEEVRPTGPQRAGLQVTRWRPAILLLGGLSSALANPKLQEGWLLALVLSLVVGVTGVVALAGQISRARSAVPYASASVGMLGWGLFATLTGGTGGLTSPFVAAFLLEIVVAGVTLSPRGVLWVTLNALGVMGLMAWLYGLEALGLLVVEALFVGAIGVLAAFIAGRRLSGEIALKSQGEQLGARLDALQRELEDERVISRVGENVARLAHGLKNAVHSLRGFVALLEPELGSGPGARAALRGLHAAIDDLEALARLTLADRGASGSESRSGVPARPDPDHHAAPGVSPTSSSGTARARLSEVVGVAHTEVSQASPGVAWRLVEASGGPTLDVAIGAEPLTELLVILMRNAVEAMNGAGRGSVEWGANGDFGMLLVSDEGPGFAPEQLEKIFQPGYTTKAGGSGFGLFLARRIVEDHGGALSLERGENGGARVRVELPRTQTRGD